MEAKMVKLNTLDLQEMMTLTSPFSIGIDDFFRRIDNVSRNNSQSYPPYNITKIDDEHFVIEIACAGFGKDHIDIEVQENELRVVGDKENPNPERIANSSAIHTGIAARKWNRKFVLSDDVQVGSASIEDGILSIPITKVIPEEKKPKKISIGTKKLSKEFLVE
jgi:molecular chaperone IbpA|tara:strand:+ start:470 stop:961 length:492 start_codon:yes stop_codon:yes gene_type:complete